MLMPASSVGMGVNMGTYAHTLILLKLNCGNYWTSLVAQTVKNMPAMQETRVLSLGQEDPLEKGMATHSSILAWRIPWTREPGRLQSMGLRSWTQLSYSHTHTHTHTEISTCPLLVLFFVCVFTTADALVDKYLVAYDEERLFSVILHDL